MGLLDDFSVYPKKMGDILDETFSRQIEEGYYKSYPTEVVKRNLKNFLEKNTSEIDSFDIKDEEEFTGNGDKENDFQILYIAIEKLNNSDIESKIKAILDQCGWYIGDKAKPDKDMPFWFFTLEPKFPVENSSIEAKSKKLIEKTKIFYHISFKKYEQKILRRGLIPSITSRQEFFHPERIYLFSDRKIAEQFAKNGYTTMLSFSKSMNIRKTKQGTIDAEEKYQDRVKNNADLIVAFEVNLDKLLKDGKVICLYHDNRFNESGLAYFTHNSIPPKYLKLVKSISPTK